jgi:hypothetical protein
MKSRRRADQPGALTTANVRWTGLFVLATKLDELLQRPEHHWQSQHHERAIRARGSNRSAAAAASLPRTEQSSPLVSVG